MFGAMLHPGLYIPREGDGPTVRVIKVDPLFNRVTYSVKGEVRETTVEDFHDKYQPLPF